jgi:hypothetical protein
MARSRLYGGVAVTFALTGGITVLATGTTAADGAARPVVEAETCARPDGRATVEAAPSPGETAVSFEVAGETRLRVVASGAVVAASTNTGCRPRAGDPMVVVDADGRRRPATAAESAQAVVGFTSGDWQVPGRWHARD